jgi:protein phosphatase
MRYGAKTDKGIMRQQNEDNFCMANLPDMPFSLFAVADGVGGHKAGEVASEIAAEVFARNYQECHESNRRPEPVEFLKRTAQEANEEIVRKAYGSEHTDMGTTLVASAVTDRDVITINFGDSRAYIFSQGKLRQLTVDHTIYAEFVRSGRFTADEAKKLYGSNRITNGLGFFACPTGDLFTDPYIKGDKLMLCSDGLSGMLSFEEIRACLSEEADPSYIADKMVEMANAKGGRDNITAVVVQL